MLLIILTIAASYFLICLGYLMHLSIIEKRMEQEIEICIRQASSLSIGY